MINSVLAARRTIGGPLAVGGGGASPWFRAGGAPVPAAAYRPKGAASLIAAYVNLPNPGVNDAVPVVVPGWDAENGWDFNGAEYLTTGLIPAMDSSWSMLIQFTNGPGSGSPILAGSTGVGSRTSFYIQTATSGDVLYANGGGLRASPSLTAGNLALAGSLAYRNGVMEPGGIPGWIATSAAEIYIGCRNNNGTPQIFTTAMIQAIAIYSTTLTGSQVAAVAAAMAAL